MLLGLFKNMIIQQSVNINYNWLVLSVLWIVITPGFLTLCILLQPEGERSSQKKKQKYEKKSWVWETSSLSWSVFQRPWLCGSENKKNLYVGLEFSTVHEQQVFHVIPNSGKRFQSWIYNLHKRKAWFEKENMSGRSLITYFALRTAANWNSIRAKTITSVSWILGDNLFPAFVVFLTQFSFTSWDSSFKDIVAGFVVLGLIVFFELMEVVHKSLHVSPAVKPSPCLCWKMIHWALAKYTSMSVSVSDYKFRIWDPVCECVCVKHLSAYISVHMCPHVFPWTLPICSRFVAAQCQHPDVWPLSLQQEFVWNL